MAEYIVLARVFDLGCWGKINFSALYAMDDERIGSSKEILF